MLESALHKNQQRYTHHDTAEKHVSRLCKSNMPFFRCNLALIGVLAGPVIHIPEEEETRQDAKASHRPIVSVYHFAAGLGTRNAAVLKLAALTKGSHRLQTTPWRLVYH